MAAYAWKRALYPQIYNYMENLWYTWAPLKNESQHYAKDLGIKDVSITRHHPGGIWSSSHWLCSETTHQNIQLASWRNLFSHKKNKESYNRWCGPHRVPIWTLWCQSEITWRGRKLTGELKSTKELWQVLRDVVKNLLGKKVQVGETLCCLKNKGGKQFQMMIAGQQQIQKSRNLFISIFEEAAAQIMFPTLSDW